MSFLKCKKGLEIGINAIIIIALALIALVIIVAFFFGGFSVLGGSVGGIGKETKEEAKDVGVEEGISNIKKSWSEWECPRGLLWYCVKKDTGKRIGIGYLRKLDCNTNGGNYYYYGGKYKKCNEIYDPYLKKYPYECRCGW